MNKFKKIVQWSEADKCFIGRCPGIFHGGACHGDNELEVFQTLSELVEETIHHDLEPHEVPDVTPYLYENEPSENLYGKSKTSVD